MTHVLITLLDDRRHGYELTINAVGDRAVLERYVRGNVHPSDTPTEGAAYAVDRLVRGLGVGNHEGLSVSSCSDVQMFALGGEPGHRYVGAYWEPGADVDLTYYGGLRDVDRKAYADTTEELPGSFSLFDTENQDELLHLTGVKRV